MYDDPIVAEIRRLRDEYASRFDYDLDAICQDLREQQARSGRRVVRRQPRDPGTCRAAPVPEAADASEAPAAPPAADA